MVTPYNRGRFRWQPITRRRRKIRKANLPRTSTSTATAAGLLSGHQQQPQQPLQTSQLQHPTSNSIRIEIRSEEEPEIKSVEDGRSEKIPRRSETDWVVSIRGRLEQARQAAAACPWDRLSIYRIPHYLKDGEDKAYNPQIVSLGPYHHGKEQLRPMDLHKWRSLHRVLMRTGHDITLYLNSIKELEDRARACYEGQIPLGSEEFIEMMVLDGCFILELFRGAVEEGFEELGYPRSDPVFSMSGLMHSIQRDMIMLENQIPMFILDRLLEIQIGDPDQKVPVAELALRFFDSLKPTDPGFAAASDPLSDYQSGLHCLEVFRRRLLGLGPKPVSGDLIKQPLVADKRSQQLIHCVTELTEAGIKVRKRKTDRFWDIQFKNGVLYIPRLLIHDGTRSLFLNLIAYEQSHLDCSNEVTSYMIFMDNLINSPEDVAHLHYYGIIEHWLGSDAEVADLFNRLCKEVFFDMSNSYLSTLSGQVNRYCEHRWNEWRASLKHNYLSSPWAIISVIAAVVLLLLTFAQTFYGVYGYYRPAGS